MQSNRVLLEKVNELNGQRIEALEAKKEQKPEPLKKEMRKSTELSAEQIEEVVKSLMK